MLYEVIAPIVIVILLSFGVKWLKRPSTIQVANLTLLLLLLLIYLKTCKIIIIIIYTVLI